jgi:hypothetical protein
MNSSISLIFKSLLFFAFCFPMHWKAQVADSNAYYRIRSVQLKGNSITKNRIILRELVKNQNDSLQLKDLNSVVKRSEYNIFNTQLFVYDTIHPIINDSLKLIDYQIKLKERWYIWPVPFVDFLDRNINAWWKEKDMNRLAYGLSLTVENVSGRKDRLILQFQSGYANQFGVHYKLPYLNKKQTLGAYVQGIYNEYKKLSYTTRDNRQQFAVNENITLRTEIGFLAGLTYRPNLFLSHVAEAGYYRVSISDSLVALNPNYFLDNATQLNYANLMYRITYDTRDNKVYPLKGLVLDAIVSKNGLNISENSPLDITSALFSFKTFVKLSPKFYIATLNKTRLYNTERKVPFAFNQALGYGNSIRGYEYYVIDGQNFFLTKNSLRFEIIKPKFHEVQALQRFKSFSTIPFYAYLNVYADAGYVKDEYFHQQNPLANHWQYGYGAGIDFVSYYDIVLRLEYSVNRQQQGGFFVHFVSGF